MQQIITDIKDASNEVASNLAGYAAQAALQTLTTNWADALHDSYPGFTPATMANDIDDVIGILTRMKVRISASGDANQALRQALGIA